jgi:hypothetical protein
MGADNARMWSARVFAFSISSFVVSGDASAGEGTRGEALAHYAETLVGKQRLISGDSELPLDSVGVARLVFLSQGIDLFNAPAFLDPARTGVDIIYQYAALYGRLHTSRRPKIGDLVFFGKTRDADRDGEPDPISHVGIVTQLSSDGTAKIVTASRAQVVTLSLNRLRPKDTEDELQAPLNSRLFVGRAFNEPKPVSELFYTFATVAE